MNGIHRRIPAGGEPRVQLEDDHQAQGLCRPYHIYAGYRHPSRPIEKSFQIQPPRNTPPNHSIHNLLFGSYGRQEIWVTFVFIDILRLIELPVEWLLDDYPYFGFDWGAGLHNQRSSREVLEIWKDEFRAAYQEKTILILTMHPLVIGHRSRIDMLERLIKYIRTHPDVWFATHEQIARWVAKMMKKS